MRGIVAVVVRAHSGTTYASGFFTIAGCWGRIWGGHGCANLERRPWQEQRELSLQEKGSSGNEGTSRRLSGAAKRSALGRGVCVDTGLLG
jgi:hypothetical protein